MDVFIDKFVLCGSCKNPETELIITKDDFIYRDCKACGQRSDIDMRHKLATFILKNPPKSKKVRGSKKAIAGADSIAGQPAQPASGDQSDEDADELTKKIEAGAAQVMTDEQAAALIAKREAEDDWAIDTSPEAVAARVQQLDAKLQSSLVLGDDDDDEGGGPYESFGEMVRDARATDEGITDAEVYKRAEEQGLAKKHKLLVVLVQALFTEQILSEIPSHLALFSKVGRRVADRSLERRSFDAVLSDLTAHHVGEAPKVPPRRPRTSHWRAIPSAHSRRAQNSHGVLPSRYPRRRSVDAMGHARVEEGEFLAVTERERGS